MALDPIPIKADLGVEVDMDGVRRGLARVRGAAGDVADGVGRADQTLGAEKPGSQFPVGSGCAHEYGKAFSIDPDVEWFLRGHLVHLRFGWVGRCQSRNRDPGHRVEDSVGWSMHYRSEEAEVSPFSSTGQSSGENRLADGVWLWSTAESGAPDPGSAASVDILWNSLTRTPKLCQHPVVHR